MLDGKPKPGLPGGKRCLLGVSVVERANQRERDAHLKAKKASEYGSNGPNWS
jgi:hypothetical protein